MPTHLILFVLLALLLTLTVASAADLTLFDFGKGFDPAQLKTRDTKAEVVDQAGHKALRVTTGQAQDWPGLDLPAKFGPWDLTQYESVCADVRNVGMVPVEVYFRVDNPGADGIHFCITRHLEVAPGKTETLQVTLNRLQPGADQIKIFGVRGSPLGLSDQPVLDPKAIVNLVVFVSKPKQDYTFEISNIRATGTYVAPPEAQLDPAKFFPLIDEFGQYRHRDWPGKIHNAAELVANRELEAKDLAAHPGPEGWDQYGGWQGGPQLQATGFFHPEKYQGKWWLVDPEGRLFWSHGVDCVTDWEGATRLDEREHWFANLPPADGEFKGCYGQVGKAVNGYYAQKSSRTFDFTRANLMRKYGDDYKPSFSDLAHRRLRSYGMNTIANWSDAAICLQRRTPYTVNIWFDSKRLEGSQGYWGKFRDVFDESFAGNVRKQMQAQVGKSAGDPWCLGYFVDNELGWGEAGYLPVATLACPPDQAAKKAFLADLQAKYGTIDKLNEAWGTQHGSWEALAEFRGAPDKAKAAADLAAFDIKTAETYFKTIRDVLREVAPGNLYLGCRFAWINDTAARAATKYCDVVSYNLYRPSVADFKPLADVPVIIGEFHFGALDRGMFHTGLGPVASQAARAEAYRNYVQGALRNPYLVGTGWFKYMDEPTTGRTLDEENYQIGLVDGCDTPYATLNDGRVHPMRPLDRLVALICLLWASAALAAPLASLDFEQGTDLKAYPTLVCKEVTAEIVAGGADGAGHCLKIVNKASSKYCQATVKGPFPMQKNLVLSFDHKEQIEGGKALYLGTIFDGEAKAQWYTSDTFSPQWRHVELVVGDMMSPTQTTMTLSTVFGGLNLYGRADNDAQGVMTVWLDNLRLEVRQTAPKLGEGQRISYSNPPFFNWPGGVGKSTLQYSLDPAFPGGQTTSVELSRNFYMPALPLAAGTWYWRVKRETELADSWGATARVTLLPESHRFTTPPIPADLATRPHPRLIVAKPAATESERVSLIASASWYLKQGVPDDPPAYAPGNPDWPTWIDWYGKVHGGITSNTGMRLQKTAELYVRTRSPEIREALKAMVLKAATWNPEGGSSMKNGDIGAQHFLRGLNRCYDALYNDLTEPEREQLRKVIVARALQFWKLQNPFRTGHAEYNNHAWLCTLALGESGLLLTGEVPEAADWAEYSRELYLGLYLCGLGWQGDNNEGIAYWGYGLSFVIQYADLLRDVCGIDLFQHPWLYQTARFPLYTTIPGAWAVSFADTAKPNHSIFGPAETSQVHDLALRTKDPYALWYSGDFKDANFAPKPPVDLPQSLLYRFIGWSVYNTSLVDGSENVTFALRSGPFWAGHQHEDQNSFVLNAYGEKLAIDSGYYDWFGSPHFTQYSVLTRAHNAILVNGLDQDSRKPGADGKITTWFDSPGFGYTVGDASSPLMYQGNLKRWDRRALFLKPGFVILHDVLGAQAPAQYGWLLHTVAPIETSAGSAGILPAFSFTSGKASLSGTLLSPKDLSLQVKAGYPVEPVDGYSTRPVPPEKYSHEWTLTATPQEKRQDEDILVVLQVQRGDGQNKARVEALEGKGAFGVKITDGAETTLVLSRKREAQGLLSGGGLQSDGEIAAVVLGADGKVQRALLIGGKKLALGGKDLIVGSEILSAALTRSPAGTFVSASISQPGTILRFPQERPTTIPILLEGNGYETVASDPPDRRGAPLRFAQPGDSQLLFDARLPLKPETVKLGGVEFQSAGNVTGGEYRRYFWTALNVPEAGRYRLSLTKPAPGLKVSLDNRPLPLEKDGSEAQAWVTPGRHLLMLSGALQLPALTWASQKLNLTAATMLPADYRPVAQALAIEAEQPSSEGAVKSQTMDKVGASGGKASCVWDTPGQWAEWVFTTPREGDYRLLVRGCSEQTTILRSVEIDRGTPQEVSAGVSMQGTGGWARTTDDWRYFVVNGKDGQPLRLHLPAGTHALRLEGLGGSMNLDRLVFEPAP